MKEVAGTTFTQTIKLLFVDSWDALHGKSAWHQSTEENYNVRAAGRLASEIPARGGEVRKMAEYLDKNLAVEELENLRQQYEMHDDCDELVASRCKNAVLALPTADVVPVVHAKWETNEVTGEIYCSDCLENAVFTSGHHYYCGTYCPNCGAKMDGGEE